jgi:hypothetical protein
MADYPVFDSDMVMFTPNFGVAVVAVIPGNITGTGKSTSGNKICVEGDEASVEVAGCPYFTPQFITPGTGTLKVGGLAPNQLSIKTTDSGKKIILKGNKFIAKFQVQSPAIDPTTGMSDFAPSYPGTGEFITTNFKITIA